MADVKTLIGQYIGSRLKNPDTQLDPYDPARESFLENPKVLPNPDLILSTPSALPPPPIVVLSHPGQLPVPPAVTLGSPSVLPPEPAPALSTPSRLPNPPAVSLSAPEVLPDPPIVSLSSPSLLPPPPLPIIGTPALLPDPPPVVLSSPGALPPPPLPVISSPAALPQIKAVRQTKPGILPEPPEVKNPAPHEPVHPASPVLNISSGYAVVGETYSPIFGGSDPGALALDPILYERHLERMARLAPGKLAVHAAVQVGMFAQNIYGRVWNPALAAPPPGSSEFLMPALDLVKDAGDTEMYQVRIGSMVTTALANANLPVVPIPTNPVSPGNFGDAMQPVLSRLKKSASQLFGLQPVTINRDQLVPTSFDNGIIPMRLKGDNALGFRTFRKSEGDQTDDDSVYVPLCFTDLRPVGDVFRTVYFRPIITSLAESLSPQWNEQQYYGRVDPVATYQSTKRTVSLSFQLVAFGPEDVRTIYQKLHWLSSMVYPEYDNNLVYKSGPVIRMRVGDVINAAGNIAGKGLPGILTSLDYDYSDKLWELNKTYKLPRSVDVSLSFTVLHDVPIGRGTEGKFGGIGEIIPATGIYTPNITNIYGTNDPPVINNQAHRDFGDQRDLDYETMISVDAIHKTR